MSTSPAQVKKISSDVSELADWYTAHRPDTKVVHVSNEHYRKLADAEFGAGTSYGFHRHNGEIWFGRYMIMPTE